MTGHIFREIVHLNSQIEHTELSIVRRGEFHSRDVVAVGDLPQGAIGNLAETTWWRIGRRRREVNMLRFVDTAISRNPKHRISVSGKENRIAVFGK
ncbi:MAG: hypothetical protein WDM76_06625 [Limisphaerales bacterium]